jgi:hypothetical protein
LRYQARTECAENAALGLPIQVLDETRRDGLPHVGAIGRKEPAPSSQAGKVPTS